MNTSPAAINEVNAVSTRMTPLSFPVIPPTSRSQPYDMINRDRLPGEEVHREQGICCKAGDDYIPDEEPSKKV